jgi:hypothetical protein
MNFLPTENITYKTKLKEEEILGRLSGFIESENSFRLTFFGSGSTKSYSGHINAGTFDIKRIINYRNSFLPRITGAIEKDFDGTTVKVKMRLHPFTIIFFFIWCGFVGLGCIAFLVEAWASSELTPGILVHLGLLIFIYVLTMVAFKIESNKSKKDLQALFEADIMKA